MLVLAPTGRDAAVTCAVLAEEGFTTAACPDVDALSREIDAGAGAAVIAEEALADAAGERLAKALARQPPWSDLPILLFAAAGASEAAGRQMLAVTASFGNVTVLDRPVRVVSLVSAVRSAVRARQRQYEVRALLEALERGVRDRDAFMALLGHELRNPLAAITFALDFLGRAADEDPTRRKRLGVIERQVGQLRHLVDDLLDVSRLTTGKVTLSLDPVEMGALCAGCVETLQEMARPQRVRLDVSLDPGPIVVRGDEVRLQQILTNLVTNALKYTPAGGRVHVALRAVEAPRPAVELVVEDTGVGIAPDMLDRIFVPFVQVEGDTDRSRGGLGLGLSLVRGLVDLHGGAVHAESGGVDRGSRFVVRLPREAAAAPAAKPARGAPSGPRRQRKVVIVEDSPDVREGLAELVRSLGHEVAVAEDGPSGLAVLRAVEPDVALVDLGLPGIDGFHVARAVRAARGDRVVLVAMSGYGAPVDRRRSREAGFDAHLIKPVSADTVALVIDGSRP